LSIFKNVSPSLSHILMMLCIFGVIVFFILFFVLLFSLDKKIIPSGHVAEKDNKKKLPELPPLLGKFGQLLARKGYLKIADLGMSFLKVLDYLEQVIGVGRQYMVPWYMLMGKNGSGKTSLLKSLNLPQPAGQGNFYGSHQDPPCKWWFFSRGIVMDLKGDFFCQNSDHFLHTLLVLLSRYRSARPVNGIILTVSAKDFYGKDKLSHDELCQEANDMSKRLLMTQRSLNLQLPVYVILTHCDAIPGFETMVSALPSHNENNMFGWSSPYHVQHVFTQSWVEEAFDSLLLTLDEVRLEIFAKNGSIHHADALFVLPQEFMTLRSGLTLFLTHVFQSDVYQNPPMFRGLYCTAQKSIDHEVSVDHVSHEVLPTVYEGNRHIKLIQDVFEKKIFSESNLCFPQHLKIIGINKGMNALKIATCSLGVLGVGLSIYSYTSLAKKKRSILPVMDKTMNVLNIIKNNSESHTSLFSTYAQETFQAIEKIDHLNFFSICMPPSWFSSLSKDITKIFNTSYQHTIIEAIRFKLMEKLKNLTFLDIQELTNLTSFQDIVIPLKSPTYLDLKKFVDDFLILSERINQFNTIKGSLDGKDFEDLVHFTFQATLPPSFFQKYETFRRFLMDMDIMPIDISVYEQQAKKTLSILYKNFLDSLLNPKYYLGFSYWMNVFFDRNINFKNLRHLSKGIEINLHILQKPGKSWIDQERFLQNTEFDELMKNIEKLKFFGQAAVRYLMERTQRSFSYFKTMMMEHSKKVVASPLYPSVFLFEMEKILTPLFKEKFMDVANDNYQFRTDITDRQFIHWNQAELQDTFKMMESFEHYKSQTIPKLPQFFQNSLNKIIQLSLEKNIIKSLALAQDIMELPKYMSDVNMSEKILKMKMGEFKKASHEFLKILDLLSDENVGESFIQLQKLLSKSCIFLLERVDILLMDFKPYVSQTDTLSFWSGNKNLIYDAYGLENFDELKNYLSIQREYIQNLAIDYAKPVLEILKHPLLKAEVRAHLALVKKWQRIVQQVELYQKKSPQNNITSLEKFMIKVNSVTLDNVLTEIKSMTINEQSLDIFSLQQKKISDQLLSRAELILKKKGIENYKKIETFFNEYLKGRFPFAPKDTIKNENLKEVDLDIIQEFFKIYDDCGGNPEKILKSSDKTPALTFLQKIQKVKDFLEVFLQEDDPKFAIEIDFRTNKQNEKNSKFLVDYSFQVSDEKILQKTDSKRYVFWTVDRDVSFTFRFPKSPDLEEGQAPPPMPKPILKKNSEYTINKDTVTFSHKGKWALIKLLYDFSLSLDKKNMTLKFNFPFLSLKGEEELLTVYNDIRIFYLKGKKKIPTLLSCPLFPDSLLSED
jgi:type VI secretion system protein ImpL